MNQFQELIQAIDDSIEKWGQIVNGEYYLYNTHPTCPLCEYTREGPSGFVSCDRCPIDSESCHDTSFYRTELWCMSCNDEIGWVRANRHDNFMLSELYEVRSKVISQKLNGGVECLREDRDD